MNTIDPEDTKRYIVAMRCKEVAFQQFGASKMKCSVCGEEVWICKELQNEVVDGAICNVCVEEYKKKHEVKFILKPEVVEAWLKIEMAEYN